MKLVLILFFLLISISGFSQEEIFEEADKLESGQVEPANPNQTPEQSAEEIESELENDLSESFQQAAPDTLPDDIEEIIEDESMQDEVVETPDAPSEPVAPSEPIAPPVIEDLNEVVEEAPINEEPSMSVPPPAVEEEPIPIVETPSEFVPDDFEARLNSIYQRFYSEATSDETWKQIVGEKIDQTYTVQAGDTLWDLSVTFFGNGHFWPKMWQVNNDITNPHIIEPGYVLKFIPGKSNEAPQLQITDNQTSPPAPEGLEDPNSPRRATIPVIPPPTKKSVPVVQVLPPSLPIIKSRATPGLDAAGFFIDTKKPLVDSKIYVTSYLSELAPDSIAEIVEHDGEERSQAGVFDQIYIQSREILKNGERLMVYKIGEKIRNADGQSVLGSQVNILGEIQIQQNINPDENIYKAIVTKALSQISTGASITRASLPFTTIDDTGSSGDISADIIGGQFDNNRFHLAKHELIYINKGTQDGVRNGQVFSVIKNPKIRGKKDFIKDLNQQIAKIKVVKTTPGTSTALILSEKDDVRRGDLVGPLRKQAAGDETSFDGEEESSGESDLDSEIETEPDVDEFIEGE